MEKITASAILSRHTAPTLWRGILKKKRLAAFFMAFILATAIFAEVPASADEISARQEETFEAAETLSASSAERSGAADSSGTSIMYRLYNPNSGEHFYTASITERKYLSSLGWRYEGIAWTAPVSSDSPVFRLYNPNAGDHHYTLSKEERDLLVSLGWNYEGVGWYSESADRTPVYRLYNPNAVSGAHHYTLSKDESDYLSSIGWRYEGICWYSSDIGSRGTDYYVANSKTAEKTSQIITVADHSISLWNKNADGTWAESLSAYCGYGRNGLAEERKEGDGTTPIGSFPLLFAFGKAQNPGTAMTWRSITPNSYWSGVRNSTYNTWVESPTRITGEHLTDYPQYKYACAIGFNTSPTVIGKGSAIFLHCKSANRWSTAGCVSVEESEMVALLRQLRDGAYIIIVPNEYLVMDY